MYDELMKIVRCDRNGRYFFKIPGIDYGVDLEIFRFGKKFILAKCSGHMDWCGIGSSKYRRPKFLLFKKIRDGVKYPSIKEWEYTRATRKKFLDEAYSYFNKMEAKS